MRRSEKEHILAAARVSIVPKKGLGKARAGREGMYYCFECLGGLFSVQSCDVLECTRSLSALGPLAQLQPCVHCVTLLQFSTSWWRAVGKLSTRRPRRACSVTVQPTNQPTHAGTRCQLRRRPGPAWELSCPLSIVFCLLLLYAGGLKAQEAITSNSKARRSNILFFFPVWPLGAQVVRWVR